jgi:NAD(P)-dependent dehydrogenase (short-subunit alcohol dehydrogenase family)
VVDLPHSAGADAVSELGGHASFVPADVTSGEEMTAAFAAAANPGPVRVVVHSAGIGRGNSLIQPDGSPAPLDEYAHVITVNLVGTYNVARLAAACIAKEDVVDGERGVIITTSSITAFDGMIGQAAYASSKGGVAALTLPLARELAERQIRVMSIAPGSFATPMKAQLPEPARVALGALTPHPNRLGDPSEFGALVAHIVANPMLNGETIRLDGAVRMPPRMPGG